jgi:hypothetical protein
MDRTKQVDGCLTVCQRLTLTVGEERLVKVDIMPR